MQRAFNALLFASTLHADNEISDILRGKGGHIRKHLCGKRVSQGARTVLGGDPSLKIDQSGIPKDICKTLTKPMVVNSLKLWLVRKTHREKKVNYIQKGELKISLKFHKPVIDIGDILHVHLMKNVKTFKISHAVTKYVMQTLIEMKSTVPFLKIPLRQQK